MHITIREELAKGLSKRADEYEFESTETYVNEVLNEILQQLESDGQDDEVRTRLDDLGYL